MQKTYRWLAGWLIISLVVMACTISFGGGVSEEEAVQTAIAQTLTASGSDAVETASPEVTLTLAPTNTVAGPPTNTPSPCNNALFVSETVPDGTEYDVGENFTKTWRLKNVGTCTWNTNYKLVFISGNAMGGAASKNLTSSIAPGQTVSLSVSLTAPSSAGTHKGV